MNAAQMIIAQRRADREKQPSAAARIIAERRANRDTSRADFDAANEEDNSGWNSAQDQADSARAFYGGATLGFNDEIEAAAKAVFSDRKEGEGFKDAYSRHKKKINEEEERFARENPGSALALGLSGGFLTGGAESGLMRKGAGKLLNLGKTDGQLLLKASARRANAVKRATEKAAKAGKAADPMVLSEEVAKTLKRGDNIRELGKNIATSTGVGALAGAGYADEGDTIEGMKSGAMFGGALPLAMAPLSKLAGKMSDIATKRKTAQALDSTLGAEDAFIPIELAEGGNSRLMPKIASLAGRSTSQTYRDAAQNVADRVKIAEGVAGRAADSEKRALTDRLARRGSDINEVASDKNSLLKATGRKRISDAEIADAERKAATAKQFEEEALAKQNAAEQAITDTETAATGKAREEALRRAVPTNTSDDEMRQLLSADSIDDFGNVENFWGKYGFKSLTGADNFDINANKFVKEIPKILEDDLGREFNQEISKRVSELLASRVKDGKISGKDMAQLRTNLRILANDLSESGKNKIKKVAVGKVSDRLDSIIKSQLKGDARQAFIGDLSRYKDKLVLREAAKNAVGSGGRITPQNIASGIKKIDQNAAIKNESDLLRNIRSREEAVAEAKGAAATQKATTAAERAKLAEQEGERKVALKKRIAQMREENAGKETEQGQRLSRAKKLMTTPNVGKTPTQERLGRVRDVEKTVARAGQEPQLMTQSAALRMAGNVLPALGIVGGGALSQSDNKLAKSLSAVAMALGLLGSLRSKSAQRALAGQLKSQKKMNALLGKLKGETKESIERAIRRALIVGRESKNQ
jgi:hypothetical protein